MTTQHPGGHDVIIGAPATFVDRVRPDGVIIRFPTQDHQPVEAALVPVR